MVDVKFKMESNCPKKPEYATAGSAALDLRSAEPHTLQPGASCKLDTGVAFEIPEGYVGLVFARSGNAARHQIGLTNGVGVIDSDFRAPIGLLLTNYGNEPYEVQIGERMAQILFLPVPTINLVKVDELSETVRGTNGLGSTGKVEITKTVVVEHREGLKLRSN